MFSRLSVLAIVLCSLSACGGGSGGGDGGSSVQFSGSVSTPDQTRVARALAGVEVCALGSCSETDVDGFWSFSVPDSGFNGGQVLFTLTSIGAVAEVLTPSVEPGVSNVVVDFSVANDGSVTIASFTEDGVASDDFTIDGDSGDDQGDLPSDPSQRACAIISNTNIVITDINQEIQVSNDPASCPGDVPFLMAVANPSDIAFDYQITVDFGGVMPVVSTGSLEPGEIDQIEGSYDCSNLESYSTVINASIANYYPGDEAGPISSEQALADCGANAAIGNTVDSADIVVVIQ